MEALRIIKGDKVLLRYQLLEDGRPKPISGNKFRLDLKTFLRTFYVQGFIEDARKGKFSFLIKETDETLSGIIDIKMLDRSGRELTLTPAGGIPIEIVESGAAKSREIGERHGVLL